MSVALVLTAGLVFGIGISIQRGNTCTVVAIDDLIHRRSWHSVGQLLTGRPDPPVSLDRGTEHSADARPGQTTR